MKKNWYNFMSFKKKSLNEFFSEVTIKKPLIINPKAIFKDNNLNKRYTIKQQKLRNHVAHRSPANHRFTLIQRKTPE